MDTSCAGWAPRAVIMGRGVGISPKYYESGPRLLCQENRRKIESKEIPNCLIPHLFSGGFRGGAQGGQAPLNFRPNWGPKGRKNLFLRSAPPLYLRGWMPGPPLIWRSGSTLLLSVFTQQLEILVTSLRTPLFGLNKDVLVSFVQRVDNTIHWINVYSLNNAIILVSRILLLWIVIYLVDSTIHLLSNCGLLNRV